MDMMPERQPPAHPRGRYRGMEVDRQLIRRAREEAGLSQMQLGEPLFTRQTVQSIEAGTRKPSARALRHIAGRLGMPVEAFLREGAPSSETRTRELRELVEAHSYERALHRACTLLRLDTATPALLAGAHHYAGVALYHLCRYDEALPHLVAARAHAGEVPDHALVAESFDWEAATLHMLNDRLALTRAEHALALYRRIGARRPEVEARMLRRLAGVLDDRRMHQAAERRYDEALRVAGVLEAVREASHSYHGLAGAARDDGDSRRAIELMRKAIGCYMCLAEELLQAQAEIDLAQLLLNAGDLIEADGLLTSMLVRLQKAGGETEALKPVALRILSVLRQQQGKMRAAIDHARHAAVLARELDQPRALAEALMQLTKLYEAKRQPRLANRSYRTAVEVLRAVRDTDREAACMYERLRRERRLRYRHPQGVVRAC